MLSSRRVDEILQSLREQVDVVLLDCPPLLPVTDATVLSTRVDGIILVVRARRTRAHALERAVTTVQQVSGPLFGTVLNGADRPGEYGYGGSYELYSYKPFAERRADSNVAYLPGRCCSMSIRSPSSPWITSRQSAGGTISSAPAPSW